MQDRISAAKALDRRDEFLIENDQQDDEGFHMRMLVYLGEALAATVAANAPKHSKSSAIENEDKPGFNPACPILRIRLSQSAKSRLPLRLSPYRRR